MRDIFQLTDSEQLVAAEIKRLLAGYPNTREDLVKHIKNLNALLLNAPLFFAKLAHQQEKEQERTVLREVSSNRSEPPLPIDFISFCETEKNLQSYWKELIPQQELPGYPNFTWEVEDDYNPFQQLRADICLAESLKQDPSGELYIRYHKEATRLGCFNAQFCDLASLILILDSSGPDTLSPEIYSTIEAAFELASNISKLHKSPGHCLCALTCFSIANCYWKKEKDMTKARPYYQLAAHLFDNAKELEPSSKPALNNAVPTKPFFGALQKFFRPFSCKNIETLKEQLTSVTASLPQCAL